MHALYMHMCIHCMYNYKYVSACVRAHACVCGSGQEDGRLHGFDLHLKTNRTARSVSSSTKQDINFQTTSGMVCTLLSNPVM